MSATIQFEKETARKLVHLYDGVDLNAALTFATQLQTYSNAAIERVSVTVSQYVSNTSNPGLYGLELYAKILMRDLDTLNLYGLIVPDPIESMFDEVDGDLEVKQAVGVALTTFYAAYSGRNLQFESGALCGKP